MKVKTSHSHDIFIVPQSWCTPLISTRCSVNRSGQKQNNNPLRFNKSSSNIAHRFHGTHKVRGTELKPSLKKAYKAFSYTYQRHIGAVIPVNNIMRYCRLHQMNNNNKKNESGVILCVMIIFPSWTWNTQEILRQAGSVSLMILFRIKGVSLKRAALKKQTILFQSLPVGRYSIGDTQIFALKRSVSIWCPLKHLSQTL